MCDNDKNDGGSDGKSSLLAPLLSQVPKGVSKIFILTPEILKNLGLTGHLDIRKARQDESKNINVSALNLQQSPGVTDEKSKTSSLESTPESTSSTSRIKKRKRDSIPEKIADKTAKSEKSFIENSTQLEERSNGINPNISDDPANNEKEPICITPKTKKIRRRSNAVENRKSTIEKPKKESKVVSEPSVSGVRSSKRAAKPKKFDDYVMSDIFSHKSQTTDNVDKPPVTAKRQSRKSSANKSKQKTPDCSEKTSTEKIDTVQEIKSNKAAKVILERTSMTRKSLPNDEICSAVPKMEFRVDKCKAVKTYERRNSQDEKASRLVTNDKTILNNEAEPSKQEISETLTSSAGKKICFPIHQSKIKISNIKIIKTYQKPKIKDKISPEHVELGNKSESKTQLEPATSIPEISMSKTITSTRKISENISEKQINVKTAENCDKPTVKENIGREIIEPEETNKPMEKIEPAASNQEGSLKQKIVSSMESRTIETSESKCLDKPSEIKSQMDSSKSLEKKEEFKTPEPKLTSSRLKGRVITVSKSKLAKFSGPLSVSMPLQPILQSKDDSTVAKSHLPRSPDKIEEASFSKTILPMIQEKKEIGALVTDSTISQEDKKVVSVSEPIPSKFLIEKQAEDSTSIMSMSRDVNEESCVSKTISPSCFTKKDVVLKPDTMSSVDEKAASCSKPDKPKFWIKKRSSTKKPNIPKLSNKKHVCASTPDIPISVVKKKITTSIPKVPISSDEKEIKTSLQEVPMSSDEKEITTAIPEVPISSDEKEIMTARQELPMPSDKEEIMTSISSASISSNVINVGCPILDVLVSSDEKEITTSITEVPMSAKKKEMMTSISITPISSNVKKVCAPLPKVPICSVKKEFRTAISPDNKGIQVSIPEVPMFPGKNESNISISEHCTTPAEEEVRTSIPISPAKKDDRTLIPEVPISIIKMEVMHSISEISTSPVKKESHASILKSPISSQTAAHRNLPDLLINDAINYMDILNIDSSTAVPMMCPTSLNVEEEIVPTNFSVTGDSIIVEELEVAKKILPEEALNKESEERVPWKKGKRRSGKSKISIQVTEDQETNIKVENAVLTAANSFDTLVESNCRGNEFTQRYKDDTDATSLNETESVTHEILFRARDEEDEDNIPNDFDDAPIPDSDSSTEARSTSPPNLVIDEEIVVGRPRKPRISIESPKDQETDEQVANVISTSASSFNAVVDDTCQMKKVVWSSKNREDGKNLHETESVKHEILFRFSSKEDENKDNIPNIFDDGDNPPDIADSNPSTEFQLNSSRNLVVEEKIILETFPTDKKSMIEAMDVENCIPVQDLPKKVSEVRIPRKKGRPRKPPISIEPSQDQETDQQVANVISTAASSSDTFVENTCQTKKSTPKCKDDSDAKEPNVAESEKHEILFIAPNEENKDNIPNIFDDTGNLPAIVNSDSSTKNRSMSPRNLIIAEKQSIIEAVEVENCTPVQDLPKKVSEVRIPRKRGRPKKLPISIETSEDQDTDKQVANVISTPVSSSDTFLEKTCRTKSTPKCKDDSDAKKMNAAESENHETLLRFPYEKGKDSIPHVFDNGDNNLNVVDNDSSTEIQPMSVPNSVVAKEIVLENFPTGERSVTETKDVEKSISVQDLSKKVSENRVPRKRGRPKKQPILITPTENEDTDQQVDNVTFAAVNSFDTIVQGTCRKKKPVQRGMNEIDGKGLSEGSEDEFENDGIVVKRCRGRPGGSTPRGSRGNRGRGRGRGKTRPPVDFEYVPREKSSGKKQSNGVKSKDIDDSEEPDANDLIECGKCKEKMKKKAWSDHNLSKHNDMGWRSNEEEPDFSNEKFLRSVLVAALKKQKKKNGLICEACGVVKRSANGFISHLQFCGKTEEERQSLLLTCPICGNVMMPSSMEMHERFHRQMAAAIQEQKSDASTSIGRGKRKAAEKATTKISEFTELVKNEVASTKKRRREEVMRLIEKPRSLKRAPNRWRGIWKIELKSKGLASCRQPTCKFTGDSVEALCEHNTTCPCTPRQSFVCKICKFSSESEKQVMKHVRAKHDESTPDQQTDSDFEGEDSSSSSGSDSDHSNDVSPKSSVAIQKLVHEKRQRPKTNVKFLDDLSHIDPKWHTSYGPAIRWTMEFERENYRLRLFEDLKPNVMNLLNDEDTLGYLPELSYSIRMKEAKKRTDEKPPEWVSWKRFEGRGGDGIPAFFAGGPIWALAWLPIPAPLYDHSVEQYVAVSTHPTMESVYVVGKSHIGKNLIQIWNLGHLEHNQTTDCVVPMLSYGVAHDKGTIWCLEWCPSGCYEHSSFLNEKEAAEGRQGCKRMGLLAAACSDGCVHIFSLPFPDELHFTKGDQAGNNSLPIYETKPILTLITSTAMYEKGEQNWQCVKLNWSKELGHDTIIAGYSNGYVAMWDLNSESPLFVTRRGETTLIDAFHHFYAHGHAVSFVQMIPYGGKRFFITSGYDRFSKVWDLEDTSYPVSTTKRGIALDGAWLNHWPGYVITYDDVMVHGHTYLMSLRQPGHKIFPLLPNNSPTYSVDVSDYGNSIGHGTLAGEVLVMFPHHLWNHRDMDRDVPRKRWLASSSEIVDITTTGTGKEKPINSCSKRKVGKDYVYMPETYDECKNRFGIIFRDNLTRSKRDGHRKKSRPPCSERLAAVQIEQYPFASANRISWNPNAWSYLWLCVGYQNGLVRFLNFNAVAVTRELSSLLPTHAESMLEESRRSLKTVNDPVNVDSSPTSNTGSNS